MRPIKGRDNYTDSWGFNHNERLEHQDKSETFTRRFSWESNQIIAKVTRSADMKYAFERLFGIKMRHKMNCAGKINIPIRETRLWISISCPEMSRATKRE
jgi:hypothetical protein